MPMPAGSLPCSTARGRPAVSSLESASSGTSPRRPSGSIAAAATSGPAQAPRPGLVDAGDRRHPGPAQGPLVGVQTRSPCGPRRVGKGSWTRTSSRRVVECLTGARGGAAEPGILSPAPPTDPGPKVSLAIARLAARSANRGATPGQRTLDHPGRSARGDRLATSPRSLAPAVVAASAACGPGAEARPAGNTRPDAAASSRHRAGRRTRRQSDLGERGRPVQHRQPVERPHDRRTPGRVRGRSGSCRHRGRPDGPGSRPTRTDGHPSPRPGPGNGDVELDAEGASPSWR